MSETPKDNQPSTAGQPTLIHQRQIITRQYQGILPPPESFAQYEKTYPGAAKEILSHATKQIDHRIEVENKLTAAAVSHTKLGIWLAFILIFVVLIGGLLLIFFDKPTAGFAILITEAVAIAALFVARHKLAPRG